MKFQLEKAVAVFDEMLPLLKEHYREIAHYQDIAFNPDREQYLNLDELGFMRVFTARLIPQEGEALGKIVGYSVYFVRHNLHYKDSLQAIQDVVYIDPRHRGFGKDFIKWCDDELQKEGVQAVYHHVKTAHNWGPMLERMGYKLVDLIYTRRLD